MVPIHILNGIDGCCRHSLVKLDVERARSEGLDVLIDGSMGMDDADGWICSR